MDQFEVFDLIAASKSDRFSVTTEKTVELQGPGRPCQWLKKVSSYGIKCHKDYPAEFLPAHTWAGPGESYRVIKNNRSGERYILGALDKSQGYGSSEFINEETGEVFSKYQVKKWLLEYQGGISNLFPVKLMTVKHITVIEDPVAQTVMAPADTGRDELPF